MQNRKNQSQQVNKDNGDLVEKIKDRLIYHIIGPLFFVLVLGIVFRYGAGPFSGEVALFTMILFLVISLVTDHKQFGTNFMLWNLIRLFFYIACAVAVAIFMREIGDWLFN